MENRNQQELPLWINTFLILASLYACAAAVLVALLVRPQTVYQQSQLIADITVNLNGRPLREHCTTCHPNGRAAIRKDEGTLVTAHPDVAPHSVDKLGCTGCHLGEGMALDATISHGLPGFGAREVLRGEELQASCYTCHELKPLKGAEHAWQGQELFLALCSMCHHVTGLGQGGRYGPDLSAVGSHLGLKKIGAAIRDPKKEPENSIMPRFPLSRSQVERISYFLKSRVTNPFYTTPMLIDAKKASISSTEAPQPTDSALYGEPLLKGKKCLACHAFRTNDGRVAPDLTFMGLMRDLDYLRDFLVEPVRLIPDNIMPKVAMTAEEEKTLVQFLSAEAVGPLTQSDPEHLYMALCQRCHAAAGDGFGIIQPNLANFPRAFKDNADFFRQVSDERVVKSVDEGIPGTSMPGYGGLLNNTVREELVNLIFSTFIRASRTEKPGVSTLPERTWTSLTEKIGDKTFKRECLRCHGIVGNGRGPEHLEHLPRPRNLTNRPYFAAVDDARIARAIFQGISGTAMASYRKTLPPAEVWALVEKVRQLSGNGNERTPSNDSQGMAP